MFSSRGQVAKYILLPEILPRIAGLFRGGFATTAYMMALIYNAAGLLPDGHPYLNSQNFGRFGLRHVMAQAANNLVISRRNFDQVLVYFALLIGIVLLFLQLLLLILGVVLGPTAALAANDLFLLSYSLNPGPEQDLAFILMDRVFGLQGVYNSCVSQAGVACTNIRGQDVFTSDLYPTPFQLALHAMLQFYSLGIFFVAVIIIIYFVITITAETAAMGRPFGQRVNKAWVVPRLIIFSALLMPLNIGGANAGINGAQMITFWTAKLGSNFATNGWALFNEELATAHAASTGELIASPRVPGVEDLARALYMAKVCQIVENGVVWGEETDKNVQPYLVRPEGANNFMASRDPAIPTWVDDNAVPLMEVDYPTAARFSNYGNIRIVFGSYDPVRHSAYAGKVMPRCGEILMQNTAIPDPSAAIAPGQRIHQVYYDGMKAHWQDVNLNEYAECLVRKSHPEFRYEADCDIKKVGNDFVAQQKLTLETRFKTDVETAITEIKDATLWEINNELLRKGWAGAALFYNTIADLNGEVTGAVLDLPYLSSYPFVLEQIAAQKRQNDENIDPDTMYRPSFSASRNYDLSPPEMHNAATMYTAHETWEDTGMSRSRKTMESDNIMESFLNLLLGTEGVFAMRENADVNPLAQLSSMGKSLMGASIRNLAIGIGGQGLIKLFGGKDDGFVASMASFLNKLGLATIAFSFILYYILPLMPFVYFFFAVGAWVKSIFEAVVAMPLWALAHIRIDGPGLPGRDAAGGYYLLFDIFLRPIMIVVGLLASISLFSAMVIVLNQIFDLAVNNLGGHNPEEIPTAAEGILENVRSGVDELFFTVVYVIIVYMIGTSCFKLIDLIPNQIMRWSGSKVSSFQESAGDPASQLSSTTYKGIKLSTGQLQGGQLGFLLS